MTAKKQHALHCIGCPRDRATFRFLNEEDRWYEKFEEHGTTDQDSANGGGKRFLERS